MINISNLTTFYVSQKHGNDDFTGYFKEVRDDFQGPLKSIESALEKIEDMRSSGYLQPMRIVITDDIYYAEKPIVISEKTNAVTITSENKTLISGGRKIENFKNDTFNGQKCFSADIDGIDEGFWFTDLYVDNKRAEFARYPDEGFLKPEEVENKNPYIFAHSKWFRAKKEDWEVLKNFKNLDDCFISYNHYWVDEHSPIESYDIESGKIIFKYPSRFTIDLTYPERALNYIVENAAECFKKKNQWYLDRNTKKVYYIPRNAAQTAENITVFAPVTDKLFIIEGTKESNVEHIRFENLAFANTKGDYKSLYAGVDTTENCEDGFASDIQSVCHAHGTIEFYYAHACYLENCILKNIGVHAITVNEGCDRIHITGNDIFDVGAGAVKINGGVFGCDPADATHGNTITNNIITDCGNRYFAACGVLIKHSYENTVANNDISYLYYTGISVGWVWGYGDNITKDNIIEKNHIHHIGFGKLSDMGGIYILGKQPGTIVRNNIIHDVISSCYGGYGIYTDEGSCYITVENNICYNISSSCYHQHYGRMNVLRNNIFVKSKEQPVRMSKPEMHCGIILENNIIVADGTQIYRTGHIIPGNPEAWHQSGNVQMIASSKNLIYNMSGDTNVIRVNKKEYSLEEALKSFNLETESIVADPMFADYKNNDFTLQENSPALKMGFNPIDTSAVGAKR